MIAPFTSRIDVALEVPIPILPVEPTTVRRRVLPVANVRSVELSLFINIVFCSADALTEPLAKPNEPLVVPEASNSSAPEYPELLVLWILFINNIDSPFSPHDFAIWGSFLNGCSDFHCLYLLFSLGFFIYT